MSTSPRESHALRRTLRGRYFLLLLALVVLGLSYPLLLAGLGGRIAWHVTLWLVLLGGWRAIELPPRLNGVSEILALAALGTGIWQLVVGENEVVPMVLFAATTFVFLAVTEVVLLADVLGGDARAVDVDKILGVICAYVVLGLAFAFLFLICHALDPEVGAITPCPEESWIGDYLYFSFSTLTTVGYGDLAPVGAFPRLLASAEAVIGMLYLTIVVARLVGLHISRNVGGPHSRG